MFLLVLPDEPVDRYPLWDTARDVGLFSSALAPLVHQSPFRFFDPLIKSAGRLFLHRQEEFPNASGRWERRRIVDLQATCELIFITVTRTYMLVARGSDGLRHDAP